MTLLSTRDDLTGILNRRTLMELGTHALSNAARSGRPLSALMLDLDHFKQVNDRHGHAAGDDLLCAVVRTISGKLRESDIFGRYGGEEFCVLLPDTTATGANISAERIREAVAAEVHPEPNGASRITVSVGIATTDPDFRDSIEALIAHADVAMYRAKNNGRDRVEASPGSAPLRPSPGS